MSAPDLLSVDTPEGEARVQWSRAPRPRATLVLGHGAGGGVDARDLVALARTLPARGVTVARVVQPWRVAGRKVAVLPPRLDVAWLAVLEHLRAGSLLAGPLVVGGRSAGARVACRTARATGASGVVALAFPLHPPGRPDRSRADELRTAAVPVLVLQGTRDTFGSADDVAGAASDVPDVTVVPVPDADHGLAVRASGALTQREVGDLVVERAARFIERVRRTE